MHPENEKSMTHPEKYREIIKFTFAPETARNR